MIDDASLIPITDEQAKLGQEVMRAFSDLGTFFKEALGSVPSDLVGYMGGDWLRFRRVENIAEMMKRTRERLATRGVKETEPASLTLALPILRGAADESRETLQDLWARLMAAALDPDRAGSVRQGVAEVISKMDSPDAVVLSAFANGGNLSTAQRETRARDLGLSRDELDASISHLAKLELILEPSNTYYLASSTAFGREFLRVVTD